jgi:iron complex outermembrane receptor protein
MRLNDPMRTRSAHPATLLNTVTAGIALFSTLAFAQEGAVEQPRGVEEVVVTATKTGESNVQRTPIAISALSSNALEQAHASDVRDLTQLVPNLQVAQTDAYAQIFLRGVGSNNVFNGSDPSVTVHVDGVYYARPFMQFADFLDVQRVEVLRGPQGTLYGRNSIGGTLNIISRPPGDTLEAAATVSGGDFSLFDASAYLSGPVAGDTVGASVAAAHNEHGPYRDNIVASGNDVDDLQSDAVRGQLRVQMFDNVAATTRADYASREQNVVGFSMLRLPFDATTNSILGDYDKVALNLPNRSVVRLWGVSEDIEVGISDSMQLRSITSYRENTLSAQEDGDATDQSRTEVRLGESQHQFSEELNLIGRSERLEYILGLFYFTEKVHTASSVTLPLASLLADFHPVTDTEAVGVFAQGTYHFSDQWSLTAGARYSDEDKEFNQQIVRFNTATGAILGVPIVYAGKRSFSSVTPKVSLNWSPTSDLMLYMSATRGFKSGGFNFNSANASQGFEPETLWSYELGVKSEWLSRRLRLNLTGFRYDYEDLQVNSFIAVGQTDIVNAAIARVQGVELELAALPIESLRLSANLAWLDATYTHYPNAPVPGGGFIDASGNQLNYSPEYSASVRAEYTHQLSNAGAIYLSGDYAWKDDAFYTPVNDPIVGQDAYAVVNASLGYRSLGGDWTVELYGRNLADEQYLTNVYTASAVPAGIPGAPRTYGVRVSWKH